MRSESNDTVAVHRRSVAQFDGRSRGSSGRDCDKRIDHVDLDVHLVVHFGAAQSSHSHGIVVR